ncbi:MAG: DNA polymerase III subunit delta' [Gammaproteobacteria bacterium]|nr:DNA polymerase III subunit delta' [Gammaproteobacteria bacterium]
MLEKTIYPWQVTQWGQVWQSRKMDRLAHALLLVGINGLGKKHFALTLAGSVLCKNPNAAGYACGSCHACHLLAGNSHPDLVLIEPEESAKNISVDQIRELVRVVNETTMQGGFRVVVINPATAMNVNAANALLKTLEEPTPNTLIILISDHGMRLPATIMSRCQKIIFSKPSETEAIHWLQTAMPDKSFDFSLLLKLADGAPLKALALMDKDLFVLRQDLYQGLHLLGENQLDPLTLSAKWQDKEQLQIIDLLLSWLTDVLRFQLTQDQAILINQDYTVQIAKMSTVLLKKNLLALMDYLQQTRAMVLAAINLNKQLLLEDIFIRWATYVSR